MPPKSSLAARLRIPLVAAAFGVLAVGIAGAADPAAQVDERQAQMKRMGGASKSIGEFVKEGQGTADEVRMGAETINQVASNLPTLFPEGTAVGVGDSKALPALWEAPGRVEDLAARLQAASAELAVAAATGDKAVIAQRFGAVGQVCSECHKNFRQET